MDRHALAVLIPILGMFFTGIIVFSFTRLGRAVSARIEGRAGREIEQRLAAHESELVNLRNELDAAHERLDFAERLLASHRQPDQVAPPR